MERVERSNRVLMNGYMLITEFKSNNPDLVEHEPLMAHFMGITDSRDPIPKRLKEAAKKTREYIASLRGGGEGDDKSNAGRTPNSDEFVEGPGGGSSPSGEVRSKGKEGEGEDETLAAYIAGRRKARSSHFVPTLSTAQK